MPVPDDVIFGAKPDGTGEYSYGDVRQLDEDRQIEALKSRFDSWLIGHTSELVREEELGKRVVYSPFPLAVMTCVAIGTIGEVFHGDLSDDNERRSEPFRKVLRKIDPNFSKTLKKSQKEDFEKVWPEAYRRKDHGTAGQIVYTFYRNTLIHGYRGQMVFITEDPEIGTWSICDGVIHLNPYRLWQEFNSNAYCHYWQMVLGQQNCRERKACLNYLQTILATSDSAQ